ncbi:hypothetical protein ACFL30_01015 [Candidatus Latescibacterota bacterium]
MKRRNITLALLFAASVIVMAAVVPGVQSGAYAQTDTYKSAVPVVDDIPAKKTQTEKNREISALKERPEIFKYLLSQEFLATLLSFLILFQVTYIYFKYMRKSKIKVKPNKHKPIKIKLKTKISQAENSNEKDIDKQDEIEEEPLTNKPDTEGTIRDNNKKTKAELLEEAKELKVERTKHAHRISQLLEKL